MRPGDCQRRAVNMYCIHMMFPEILPSFRRTALAVCVICCFGISASQLAAQAGKDHPSSDKPAAGDAQAGGDKAAADKAADKTSLPPLPAPAHTQQSIELNGKTLHYTVTVGATPVRDGDGKTAG